MPFLPEDFDNSLGPDPFSRIRIRFDQIFCDVIGGYLYLVNEVLESGFVFENCRHTNRRNRNSVAYKTFSDFVAITWSPGTASSRNRQSSSETRRRRHRRDSTFAVRTPASINPVSSMQHQTKWRPPTPVRRVLTKAYRRRRPIIRRYLTLTPSSCA